MTSPTFEVSGSVVAFATDGTATSFSVVPEALTFEVVNVAGYTVAVTALDELSDVNTSGVSNGDALVYDSGTWVPGTGSGGGTASVVLTGDVLGTAVAGTLTADIADSGVAAGTYGSSGTAVVVTVAADGRITSISGTAIAGGGGGSSLPDPTGNGGAVLGTNGTAASWTRSFTSPDGSIAVYANDDEGGALNTIGGATAGVLAGGGSAQIFTDDGAGNTAMVLANPDGTLDLTSTGAATVTPGDGFHVVGSVGETVLSGDDYLMSTASDTDVTAPVATFARARGSMVSKSAVTNGDILAYPLYAQGHDGTSLVLAGQITAEVDGTVATGKVPTRIRIATADADGVLTDRLVLNPDGTSELNGTLLDLDTSAASTGDVATWDGTKVVLDTPTGGGGGGGLVLIDSGTFSGSSGFNVDGVFDSTYDDYLVVLVTNGSTDIQLGFRLRASGTDSSSDYSGARLFAYGTTAGVQVNNLGSDEWQINNVGLSGPPGVARLDLYGPAVAAPSAMLGVSGGYFSSTGTITTHLNGSHDVSTAYDGFAVRPDAGTISGRWAVYGYPK